MDDKALFWVGTIATLVSTTLASFFSYLLARYRNQHQLQNASYRQLFEQHHRLQQLVTGELERLNREMTDLKEEAADLRREANHCQEENGRLRGEIHALRMENSQLLVEVQQLRIELRQWKTKADQQP